MKLIVTGCYGFIGFNFINYLKNLYKNEIKIIGIDSLNNYYSRKNFSIDNNFDFLKLNINNINKVENKILNNVDGLINFAAESHVDNSISNPQKFINSNVSGLTKLLEFSIDKKVKNFLHISTDEVYGSMKSGFAKEDSIFNPSSPYSASKGSAELMLKSFSKTYGYPVKIVRPANNYGIYQQPEKLIPFSIINLLEGNNIELYGEGKNIRHWLSVKDTCSAIDRVFFKGKDDEAYNIGSGVYLTNLEIAKKIINILNLDKNRISFIKDRPGHDFRYAVDYQKLQNLGWGNNVNFDTELEKTILWYKTNRNWWHRGMKSILERRKERFKLN